MSSLKDILIQAGHTVKGSALACPFCDDVHPSAHIHEHEGKEFLKCFKCGKAWHKDQVESLLNGTPTKKVNMPVKQFTLQERLAGMGGTVFKYTNPDTDEIDLVVVRIEEAGGKSFRQLSCIKGSWEYRAPKVTPLYNRKRVAGAKEVVVVEGEKCVHFLHDMKIIATTSPGGANSADKADWSPLYGKLVYIWPDNDEPGMSYANTVKSLIEGKCKVRMVDPSWLPAKGDVADIKGPMAREAILDALDRACDVGPVSDMMEEISLIAQGFRKPIDFPWSGLTELTDCLIPSSVVALCGVPGSSKSYWVSEILSKWIAQGIDASVLTMEKNRIYHMFRGLAQKLGRAELKRSRWQADNHEELGRICSENQDWLDRFGKAVQTPGHADCSVDLMKNYITKGAEAGKRVVIVDPITAKDPSDVYKADWGLIAHAQKEAEKHGITVILVTHPKQGKNYDKNRILIPSTDIIAGGSALERFCDCILWLGHETIESNVLQRNMHGITEKVTHNRTIHILKTRDGVGANTRLAYNFGNDLRFEELGRIVKEQK